MDDIKTNSQLKERISALETLLSLSGSNTKFNKALEDSSLPKDIATKLEVADLQSRKKIIEDELAIVSKFKVIQITLSLKPKSSTMEKIYKLIGRENVVTDIINDESILGGAIVNYEGKYKDLSLLKKIDEYSVSK